MDDPLRKLGRRLEDAFFIKRDTELIAQYKKIEEMKKTKDVLAEVSGIRNPKILDKFMGLEISPAILASLVILPLVEVAWAYGELTEEEKKTVLVEAAKGGLIKGSIKYTILEAWLKDGPSAKTLEAWIHYIRGLCDILDKKELDELKFELLKRARKVATASGGFFGLFSKISAEEEADRKSVV